LGGERSGRAGSFGFDYRMGEGDFLMERRSFIMRCTATFAALAGLALAVPGLGFFLAPFLRKKENTWQPVGKVSEFVPGTTNQVTFSDPSPLPWAGVITKTAAWLRRNPDGQFVAFSTNCTHLGCPVRWVSSADLFMCPCHGGVYTKDGDVAGGPPPRPLTRYQVRVTGENVEILTAELPV
jgi:menaquinol-cytochrome c reductase iron-sulfur subunit